MNRAVNKTGTSKSKSTATNKGSGTSTKRTKTKKKSPRPKESQHQQQDDETSNDSDQHFGLMSAEYHHELDVSMDQPVIPKKAHTISLSLLARRCLPGSATELKPEQMIDQLNNVTHVRLDREQIQNIDGLELLGNNVRNLYLQHNEISEIEGLETLSGLRFLTLSHNRIQAVQNIHDSKLGFLDLSHNSIENLDIEELPKSLVILSLVGNPCQSMPGYRESILRHCVYLSRLDDVPLTLDERRSAGHEVVSDSEDESDNEDMPGAAYDPSKPFDAQILGVFDDLSSDMFIRCQSRIQQVFEQHKSKMMNLDRIKSEGRISIDSNPASRISSRLDSPDTDNSRPATGNIHDERTQPAGGVPNPTFDNDDMSYRPSQMKLSNGILMGDNMAELAHNINSANSSAAYQFANNRDNTASHNDDELSIASPSLVSAEISTMHRESQNNAQQGVLMSRPNSSLLNSNS